MYHSLYASMCFVLAAVSLSTPTCMLTSSWMPVCTCVLYCAPAGEMWHGHVMCGYVGKREMKFSEALALPKDLGQLLRLSTPFS